MPYKFTMNEKLISRKDFLRLTTISGAGSWLGLTAIAQNIPAHYQQVLAGDDVVYFKQKDKEYDALRQGFNKRIDKQPAIIAVCKNTEGVAAAVKYAIANNLPIAIKSGGHCMEGFSCSNGGLVINLSLMNKISWVDANTITTGPAVLLRDLYNTCLPKGKILPGGSCETVALSGLALGGGYGLLSRQLGLTCDSLLKIKMVDGSGNIISSENDSELMWACRGGGNGNFGIITEMEFKLHRAPAIMQSFRLRYRNIPQEKMILLAETWFNVAATLPHHCFSALILTNKTAFILVTSTKAKTADIQKQLNDLKKITTTFEYSKPKPIAEALKVFYGRKGPLYFKNASAGLYKDFADIKKCMPDVIDVLKTAPGMIYQVNTLGGQVQNASFENASSFPHREYNFFSELQVYYDQPQQAPKLLAKFESIQHIFEQNGVTAQYRNYPDINFKDPLTKYYGDNLERLKKIKQQYDPGNNIRHEQSII
jgi:FAD/FMN-containing dehydrogenase